MRQFILLIGALLCITSCKSDNNPDPIPEPEPEPTQGYKVGDLYDSNGVKGLVFKVNEDGTSGLIASMYEPESMLAWATELIVTKATSLDSGEKNCATIFALPNMESYYPAFAWCKSLGEGWYIPSIRELKELLMVGYSATFSQAIEQHNATPLSANGKYLSSTEMDQFWVYLAELGSNEQSANYKQYTYNVRAIHAF